MKNYNNMQEEEDKMRVYTNSVIQLNIPNQYLLQKKISVKWKRTLLKCKDSLWAVCIAGSKQGQNRQNHEEVRYSHQEKNEYVCSPLDFGSLITGIVSLSIKQKTYNVQQLIYGPILVEDQIINYQQPWLRNKIGITLNKNEVYEGNIKIISNPPIFKTLQVCIVVKNYSFTIKYDKIMQCPNLIRIYEEQSNSFGLYIHHQDKQFKQMLRNFKVSVHCGKYLRINAKNRACRDLIIFQILQSAGAQIGKELSNKLNQKQIQQEIPKIKIRIKIKKAEEKNIKQNHQQNNHNLEILAFKQSTIFDTFGSNSKQQMTKNLQLGDKQQKQVQENENIQDDNENAKSTNIIEQIYNILNTPLSSIQKQVDFEFGNSKNFCFSSEKQLNNRIMICSQTIETKKDIDLTQRQKRSEKQIDDGGNMFRRKRKSEIIFSKAENAEDNENNKKKQTDKITYEYIKKQNIQQSAINKLIQTTESQVWQDIPQQAVQSQYSNLISKIRELQQKNRSLQEQKNKLKDQNLRLRFEKIKSTEIDMGKMLDIREMVQKMANRLEHLQAISQPRSYHQKYEAAKNFRQTKILQKNIQSKLSAKSNCRQKSPDKFLSFLSSKNNNSTPQAEKVSPQIHKKPNELKINLKDFSSKSPQSFSTLYKKQKKFENPSRQQAIIYNTSLNRSLSPIKLISPKQQHIATNKNGPDNKNFQFSNINQSGLRSMKHLQNHKHYPQFQNPNFSHQMHGQRIQFNPKLHNPNIKNSCQ